MKNKINKVIDEDILPTVIMALKFKYESVVYLNDEITSLKRDIITETGVERVEKDILVEKKGENKNSSLH